MGKNTPSFTERTFERIKRAGGVLALGLYALTGSAEHGIGGVQQQTNTAIHEQLNGVDSGEAKIEESLEDKKFRIKTILLGISANSTNDKNTQLLFRCINIELTELEAQNLTDEDIKNLRLMYEDLKKDCDQKEYINLDTSFLEMVAKTKQDILTSGVHQESIHGGYLKDTIAKLEECDIHPEYIVTQGNPHAPSVIFFMQIHDIDDNPEISKNAKFSQDKITEALMRTAGEKLVENIYVEGGLVGVEQSQEGAQKCVDHWNRACNGAPARLKAAFPSLKIMGFEDEFIVDKSVEELYDDQKIRNTKIFPAITHRLGAQNILLAGNVSSAIHKSGEALSAVILGAAHEKGASLGEMKWIYRGGLIPFSEILALRGLNVIVVDASK